MSSQVRIYPDPGSPPLPGGPPDMERIPDLPHRDELRATVPQGLLIQENGIYFPLNQDFTAAVTRGGWIIGKIQNHTIHPIYNHNLQIVKVNANDLSVHVMSQREIRERRFH